MTRELAAALAGAWAGAPRVFRDALATPLFEAGDFMEGVLGTAAAFVLHPDEPPHGRLFLDGRPVLHDEVGGFIPPSPDTSFAQYEAQLRAAYPGATCSIVLDRAERHMPRVRSKVTPLLHDLFAKVGYPARKTHACVYAGTYRVTPFGIHMDECHVLMLCGIGRKSIAFWPPEYFAGRNVDEIGRTPVEAHLEKATVLEIGPRDVLYWPAGYWHVGVSATDAFHAALSVGLYHQGAAEEQLAAIGVWPRPAPPVSTPETFAALDLRGIGAPDVRRLTASDLSAMPALSARWEAVRALVNRAGELERRALETALGTITSAGLGPAPRAERATDGDDLAGDDVELRCSDRRALGVATVEGGLLVGVAGVVTSFAGDTDAVERLVNDLRDGRRVRFDAALRARPDVASLVDDMRRAGVVTVERAAT